MLEYIENMSTSQEPFKHTWSQPVELNVGDLVAYVGDAKYAVLNRRVIYRVVEKEQQPESSIYPYMYRFVSAFDLENPVGQHMERSHQFATLKDFRKIELLDLGIIRLVFDEFIKEWAKSQSNVSIEHMPDKKDVLL